MYDGQYLLDFTVHCLNGWLAFRFTEHFLRRNGENRRRALLFWVILFAAGQMMYGVWAETQPTFGRFFHFAPYIVLLALLQRIFFFADLPRQAVTLASFVAGWEILRFLASPLSRAFFDAWNPFWTWAIDFGLERQIISAEYLLEVLPLINESVVFAVIFLCRLAQFAVFAAYLSFIGGIEEFSPERGDLSLSESLYLIIPCVAVMGLDITLRLMAYSVDNGATFLIYDRAPETLFLLPMVSLLLLAVILGAFSLFRGLIRLKDEEQKRLLLETSVADVQRQVTELTEIYGDIRGLRHDLKTHIAGITALVEGKRETRDDDALATYIKGMTDTVARLDFADKTGNPVTDVILHQLRQNAKRNRIDVSSEFVFPADGNFDVYDIGVILNNALQNALEACANLAEARTVDIRSYEKGGLFFIEVENDFAVAELSWEEGAPYPTTRKPDKKRHGLGLMNIERCAKKYDGAIDIETTADGERGRFTLTVMLRKHCIIPPRP